MQTTINKNIYIPIDFNCCIEELKNNEDKQREMSKINFLNIIRFLIKCKKGESKC
jgi:uncharacterized protein YktB (UPF0637 family)